MQPKNNNNNNNSKITNLIKLSPKETAVQLNTMK